jgi:hypothetical protein
MVRTSTTKTISTIYAIVERIMDSGQMSRREYLRLASAILSDYKITDEERRQINRIFDYIQIGRLKLLD